MNFAVLKNLANKYSGALLVERVISHRTRSLISNLLGLVSIILLVPTLAYVAGFFVPQTLSYIALVPMSAILLPKITGLFCIVVSFLLIFLALESFYYSSYFCVLDAILGEKGINDSEPITFGVSYFVETAILDDLTKSFAESEEGSLILYRSGISREDIRIFLDTRTARVSTTNFIVNSVDGEYGITMADIAVTLLKTDAEFAKFLFARGVTEEIFLGASRWVVETGRIIKKSERFWSRDNLGRVQGIGKDWAYGEAYILDKYSKRIFDKSTSTAVVSSNYLSAETDSLEKILARSQEANAILVGETEGGPREVVLSLAKRIEEGKVLPSLEHKRLVMLDTGKILAINATKATFEIELLKLMNEAVRAGNIILVLDDFPGFIASANSVGSNILSLIDPYISSAKIQLVALSDSSRFHAVLEPNPMLMARFGKVSINVSGLDSTMRVLELEAIQFERKYHLLFTYPALRTVAEGADRYIPNGVMPDKAISLLVELVPAMKVAKKKVVVKTDVLAYIETKTGIPTGEVGKVEKEKLMNLESLIKARVIGQDEAVSAISGALRRARSGVSDPDKPMGSFLFLGPTGVGKTETTKVLAEIFFGSAQNIIRLDMSEYKSSDALDKLIGSFTSKSPGILSTKLREHPYGVLLLDEFEKADKNILDLFLQVLDEGFFSDMSGSRVNARNLIIIATSNAGADHVFKYVEAGIDPNSKKTEIIDDIVKEGIFRPELLNRFDGLIFFHPVDNPRLRDISKLELEKFKKQLKGRGVDLVINDALVDHIMKFGSDPKFGARPIERAIKDTVEQIIANKLISGAIKQGDTVEFSAEELAGGIK